MKKICFVVLMLGVIGASMLLTGCGKKQPESAVSINWVLKNGEYPKSKKGETICYYYDNGKEVSIYFSYFLNRGDVTLRKFFADKETYELEKQAAEWSRASDGELMLQRDAAVTFTDPDAFYDQIENGGMYTLIK